MTSAVYESEEAFDRLMEDLQVILGAKAGQTLTQDDVDALQRLEQHYRDEQEDATDAYNKGYRDGLVHAGGEDLAKANERADEAWVETSTLKCIAKLNEPRLAVLPDLLAALKAACEEIADLRRYANNNGAMYDDETFAEGLAALAKAEGRAQ